MRQGLIAFVLSFSVWPPHLYAQWPQWRGSMRNGVSAETHLLKSWPAEGPKLLWSCETIGAGYSSAVIQDGRVYVTGQKEDAYTMTALNLDGTLVWEKKIGDADREDETGECSTPTFYKDKLYTFTRAGRLCCIEPQTGDVVWAVNIPETFKVESHVCESPLVVDDKVIVTPFGATATVLALNRLTGETLWQSEHVTDKTAYVSPVLVQGKTKKVMVTNGQEHVLALDLANGKIVWQGDLTRESYVPVQDDHQVYLPSGMMLHVDPDQGRVDTQWQDPLRICVFGGGVKVGDRIYATHENGSGMVCLDGESGQQLALNKKIKAASLVAADGLIYSYENRNGRVSLIKPAEGAIEVISSFRIRKGKGQHLAHMSIANGILFIRHGDTLMAYDIKSS